MNIEYAYAAQTVLRQLVANGFPVALIFAMSRFKCSRKTAWLFFAMIAVLGTVVNSALIFTVGSERMKQVYALVLLIPSLLFLLFTTKDRPSQLLFNFFTAINVFYLTSILSHFLLGGALDREDVLIWQDALVRGAFFSVILYLFVRYLREPYQFLAEHMRKSSWRVLSVIPMLFFALVMFLGLYPHVRTDNLPGVAFLYVILGFVYFIIYQVFHSTYSLLKIQNDNDSLMSQVRAMERHAEMLRQSNEQVRIYRHDMRHYIAEVTTLLQAGDTAAALRVLGSFDELNQKTVLPNYCDNPTVNAILAYHLRQAEDAGIRVEAECYVPAELPVEAAELAMVLANALENAIHACGKLPADREKRIAVRILHMPHLVLEVVNTYGGEVRFDNEDLPEAQESGHGIGTRSIAAFAEKYGAVLDYQADETMFRLRLLVNNS
ncbi:sensor histidine kinase [Anaerotruncus rubiinfantis]|uniref:sensor histidine kinase n=1 Tax=Anaerotruncus rubiinfantis TaxID=1720200 RepID=UPI00083521D3|nr:ATP-binding protein [Anaerotruncus rubiinfantis]